MNCIRWIACAALVGAVACGETVTPATDSGPSDTTVTDGGGGGGPNTCAPRVASGGAAATRALQARGFSEASATAIANYSVDFFTTGLITTACAAPNCVTAAVDAQGNVSPSLPQDWYAYRVVDPASGTSRAGLPTYGFNRIPAGAAPDTVFQVSAGTRSLLLTVYGRAHLAGTAAIAGGAADATGAPRVGATARVFVNGTQITTATGMTDTFVGYFAGPANAPTPDPNAAGIGPNGRFAAANLAVGATGGTVRVEILQNGAVVGCEEGSIFQNSVSLLNIGPVRADYPTCSGCYPHRVIATDAGTSDASTSDASTTDATTTSDAAATDTSVSDASTNG